MTNTEAIVSEGKLRNRPLVWVKQIVLFDSIHPILEIRRISFSMGLNIVQGEANEKVDTFESGHGIGKSTVCRLIRYCLGERSFGQRHIVEEVKNCFPKAYVGAVIEVEGVDWAVLRPLGHRGKEYARPGVSVLELISSHESAPYDDFISKIETVTLGRFVERDIFSIGQPIQWLHLLAMCSRDQESRYDLYWNWRDSRSDSGSPKFGKPKGDAALCVRAVLGIFDSTERKLRKQLEELEESLPRIRTKIKEKQAEPSFHITRLQGSLATDFGVKIVTDASVEQDGLFGLSQSANVRMEELGKELAKINEQLTPLDRQISLAAVSLSERLELYEKQSAGSEAVEDGTSSLLNELDKLRSQRQAVTERESRLCVPGNIMVGDCSIVQSRRAELDRKLAEQQRITLPQVSDREQAAAQLSAQAKRHDDPTNRLRQQLDDLNRQKNDLVERRRTLNDLIRRLPTVTTELKRWDAVFRGTEPNTELELLLVEATTAEMNITSTKNELSGIIEGQGKRIGFFETRFNKIVQQTVNNEFRGVVEIEEDEIIFRIKREKSLSGEAYETLAVLLADIALLAEGASTSIHHPGFLLHDSPREADLNLRIYERMLEASASLMRPNSSGEVPYQYIVTTTTLPPKNLQDESFTKLKLSGGSGSLFKRQLEAAAGSSDQDTLFDATTDT